jgi:hypothetical protein
VTAHAIQWVTAAPLWSHALHESADGADRSRLMRRPALLRFDRDSFMTDVATLLERQPQALTSHVAKPVTYRLPSPGETEPPTPQSIKLFHPAHGQFNLVAATLVCRRPGLPEHEIDPGAQEKVAFVLRRHDDDGSEWAWVDEPTGPDEGRHWRKLTPAAAAAVARDEELLPLFPLRYDSEDRRRRLFVGLVPTASGDTFKAAGALSPLAEPGPEPGAPPSDSRPAAFTARVSDPLRALAAATLDPPDDVEDPARKAQIVAAETAQQVEASRFVLLDFAELLVTHMPAFWQALASEQPPAAADAKALYDALRSRRADAAGPATSWQHALVQAWDERLILMGDAPGTTGLQLNLHHSAIPPAELDALFAAALPPLPAGASATSIQGDATEPPPVPKLDARGTTRYAIRCVYRRPRCAPRTDVVSDPSEPFQIAGFFDLDAPARSISISLPIDTSIKDLRKLRKNVSFLLSNQLREQMNRVTSLKDALDGKFADGQSLDVGLICSFSIPIITICALLVLMIFISLLNIVFWWLPFLRVCFPIALKAN